MRLRTFIAFACALLLSVVAHSQAPPVPQFVNYQGMLSNAQGQPLATGQYVLDFRIFDSPTSATEIWGPQVFDGGTGVGHAGRVSVVNGFFNVVLGTVDTGNRSIAAAFRSNARYVQVIVNGGSPILPRQQILSAPYALGSMGEVPIGGIVPFFGNPVTLPSNWKVCAGGVLNDPDSPLNGTTLPDLTNRFLRGEGDPVKDLLSVAPTRAGNDTNSGAMSTAAAHDHALPDRTGVISDSGPDPGRGSYLVRDDNVPWGSNTWLDTSSGGVEEGQHRHDLDPLSGNGGSHTHTLSDRDKKPAYVALHYIIRVR